MRLNKFKILFKYIFGYYKNSVGYEWGGENINGIMHMGQQHADAKDYGNHKKYIPPNGFFPKD